MTSMSCLAPSSDAAKRLTMPCAVPMAIGGAVVERNESDDVLARCRGRGTGRRACRRRAAPSCRARTGRSTGEKRTSRPAVVTAPMSPRVVVSTAERIASCFERRAGGTTPPLGASATSSARTMRPVAERKTRHGASAICRSGAAAARARAWSDGPAVEEQRAARSAVRLGRGIQLTSDLVAQEHFARRAAPRARRSRR